jgi:hypothetical protein
METLPVMGILHLSMDGTTTLTRNKLITTDMPKLGVIWDGTLTATEVPIDTTVEVNIRTVETITTTLETIIANGT